MKIVAITQARTGSSRLPGKVLMKIGAETLLGLHIARVKKSKEINELIVATTEDPSDDALAKIILEYQLQSYRGSVNDVLDRFYQASKDTNADYIVRLTSDCPLIDARLIDGVIMHAVKKNLDYCSNTLDPTYPDGQDVEVFRFSALKKAWEEAKLSSDREHVTPYIWKNSSFKGGKIFSSDNYSEGKSFGLLRMTVDEMKDFEMISNLVAALGTDKTWLDYASFIEQNKDIKSINENITRNEGYAKSLNKEMK
jgi:spore coat polysaccharide biosynthesis protein SpsF